jgi:hypothetical protein
MKTNPKVVRNLSYIEIESKLTGRRKIVYNAFRTLKKATSYEVSKYLKVPINCVTGRITELCNAKILIFSGIKINEKTGRENCMFEINKSLKVVNFQTTNKMLTFSLRKSYALQDIDEFCKNSVMKNEIGNKILRILESWAII